MNIQWFPGHMTKAVRMMEETVKSVDVVGYVLDARAPFSCFNPSFESLIDKKPVLFIINKCDLADEAKLKRWREYFRDRRFPCVFVRATELKEAAKLSTALETLTADLRKKYADKGVRKTIRVMIVGVPNCGKSTVINCLSRKKVTLTGDRPGVTKGKQTIRLENGIELLDTPGTLWPKFEEEKVARRLCFIGSIKDDVVDTHEVALLLLDELKAQYPAALSVYKTDPEAPSEEIFSDIAKRRGCIVKGGETDVERCAKMILEDFRKGKLGRITLDTPDDAEEG